MPDRVRHDVLESVMTLQGPSLRALTRNPVLAGKVTLTLQTALAEINEGLAEGPVDDVQILVPDSQVG